MEQGTVDILDTESDGNSSWNISLQSYSETSIFQQLPSHKSVKRRSKSVISKDKHRSSVRNPTELSTSEYTYNEVDLFVDGKQSLRELPISMAEKKRVREKRTCDSEFLSKWEIWKQSQQKSLRRLQEEVTHAISWLELWKRSLNEIEGRYGTGIQSYFTFLRFLVFLNLSAFLLVGVFVLLPSIYITNMKLIQTDTERLKNISLSAPDCFKYDLYPKGLVSFYEKILDLFSGTGFMEVSWMFYGYYKFGVYEGLNYNLPLAYLMTMIFYFLLCLCWIVKRTVNGFKQESMHESNYNTRQSAKIFALWDFCIKETFMADLKHHGIVNELKIDLAEEAYKKRKAERTTRERAFLYFIRFLLNLFIMIVLTGTFYVIYQATKSSQNFQRKENRIGRFAFITEFFMEYLPSIILTVNNILLPCLFWIIIQYEEYPPNTEINLILIRCTFLRLTNLGMLVFSLWQQVTCSDGKSKKDCETCGYNIHYQCWETKIGQEMYKLFLFDFLAAIGVTYCVELPRKFLADHVTFELPKILQKPHFIIPENVLNIVNGQTIVWVGMFYSPLLPLLNAIKCIITFYMKKHSLYYYCRPARRLFRASSSKIFFQLTLLFGLTLALVPVVGHILTLHPSKACGPFRYYESAWGIVPEVVTRLPQQAQKFLIHIKSEAFLLILITVLCIVLTTCVALVRANRRTITRLKWHLALHSRNQQLDLNLTAMEQWNSLL
ncbi:transmembrane channel-like protein 7 isoform X2 [Pristis pectinata]|uniref:transmembrane channel-like protein 7 isoform X2 n=1 Tax=Pristis pectinata TaxID=685728 RepID=UPI00223CD7FB|nr:transmembrane channel-like protein 7 isoform X2 [Pristis pectinata]